MNSLRSTVAVVILAGIVAVLSLPALLRRSPASVASLSLGTDEAFATSGIEPRENQIGGGAIRWLGPKATFQFEGAGPGLVDIDLVVRDHRSDVTLIANGARIGTLRPRQGHFTSRIRLVGPSLVFGIETDGFAATGRTLGTQIISIRVQPAQSPAPGIPVRLWLTLLALILASALTQKLSGLSVWSAMLPPSLFLLMVLPAGLWRSGWLFESAVLIGAANVVSALLAKTARGRRSSRGWLQAALLMALVVHGVLPPSPLIIQGDVQLHGNKLGEVAKGNLFPESRTDHKPPFEIPYGFSFYGVLTPWASPGISNVRVVREGAALFSAVSAMALALVLGRASAGLAAGSMILWAFAPVNIRTMAFGNLSNVFAQSIFVLFLVGATLTRRGLVRALLLALLVALSATAHLSSFIVLLTLLLVTIPISADRNSAAFKPLLRGVVLAASYYACFLPMILAQLPRLLGERGGSAGVFDPWRLPNQVVAGAGWPLLALIVLSTLVGRPRPVLPLFRSLALTGALLAIAALASPVEVRYLLALLPLLATFGSTVFDDEEGPDFPRQGLTAVVDLPLLRALGSEFVRLPLAIALLFAALVHGVLVLLEFIPLSGH